MTNQRQEDATSDINVVLLLGPPAIGKKTFILALAERYPRIFHIVRHATTKFPETLRDRIFFDYMPHAEFLFWRDEQDEEEDGRSFMYTYERTKPKTEGETFIFGLPNYVIQLIPEDQYALIGISSVAQHRAFFEFLNEEECDAVRVFTLQLVSGPTHKKGEDVLVRNLREIGITDEEEIGKQVGRADQMERNSRGIADATVLLTGNQEADLNQICNVLRIWNLLPPYE